MPSSRKPVVAVYFDDPNPLGAPFDDDKKEYLHSYTQLSRRVAEAGGEMVVVRGKDDFLGAGRFKRGWRMEDDAPVPLDGEVRADVVLDKGDTIEFQFDAATTVVNDRRFHALCNDKSAMYERFADLCPATVRVDAPDGLAAAMERIPGERVVAKPVVGACGRNVVIGSRDEVLAAAHEYPLLLQEFIDTTGGIPGLVDGAHDLRVCIVGGAIAYVLVKIPKPGLLVSNYALGGTLKVLDDDRYPADALAMAKRIDAEFAEFPARYYSIDMGRHRDGTWKLIELNSPPGLDPEERHPSMVRDMKLLSALLVAEASR